MTVTLLLNVEAGVGRHIWDLTYAEVKEISKLGMIDCALHDEVLIDI
jgi:hypothetical protein